jgi:hypothetical protein
MVDNHARTTLLRLLGPGWKKEKTLGRLYSTMSSAALTGLEAKVLRDLFAQLGRLRASEDWPLFAALRDLGIQKDDAGAYRGKRVDQLSEVELMDGVHNNKAALRGLLPLILLRGSKMTMAAPRQATLWD